MNNDETFSVCAGQTPLKSHKVLSSLSTLHDSAAKSHVFNSHTISSEEELKCSLFSQLQTTAPWLWYWCGWGGWGGSDISCQPAPSTDLLSVQEHAEHHWERPLQVSGCARVWGGSGYCGWRRWCIVCVRVCVCVCVCVCVLRGRREGRVAVPVGVDLICLSYTAQGFQIHSSSCTGCRHLWYPTLRTHSHYLILTHTHTCTPTHLPTPPPHTHTHSLPQDTHALCDLPPTGWINCPQ